MRYLRHIFLAAAALGAFVPGARAERVTIKAKLDSAMLIMGKPTTLHLEVVKDRGMSGYFPMFADGDHRPYATLNGDSIELSRKFTSDTVELGSGRTQINYHIPLQAFDSGYYYLPPIQYVAGTDTASSNRVALKVLPVNVDPKEDIEGFTDVADSDKGPWTDKIPDFIVRYWWLILLILIVAGLSVWGFLRYRRTGAIIRKKPQLPPYEAAVKALEELKARHLWENGQVEEYFVSLTDILRTYIDKRFHVSAPEMTTQQFLTEAMTNDRLKEHADELGRLLELADFVKFARMQALPDENTEAYNIVKGFVESTRPTPEEEAAAKAAAREESAPTGSGKSGRRRQSRTAGSGKSQTHRRVGKTKGKEGRR